MTSSLLRLAKETRRLNRRTLPGDRCDSVRRDAVLGRNRLSEGTGLEVTIDGPLHQHPCANVF